MSDPVLKFDPVFDVLWLSLLMILLAAFVMWLEWRRKSRFRLLRFLSLTVLLISLTALLLNPVFKNEKSSSVILLTKGFDKDVVDSLLKTQPSSQVFQTKNSESYPDATQLESTQGLSSIVDQIQYVVGNGLSASELDLLEKKSLQFIPAEIPKGVVELNLPKQIIKGKELKISGVYNSASKNSKIILESPGGKEDSVIVESEGLQQFSLSFTPKQAGTFTYTLSADGINEVIPVFVQEEKAMKILMAQYFPTFETKYLKNVLAEKNQLVFRYQVSKNNFRYEFINTPAINIDLFTKQNLESFDLLVIDSDAINNLSSNEINTISQAITNGLGVLVLFNELPQNIKKLKSILPVSFSRIQTDTAHFYISTNKTTTLPAWPIEPEKNSSIIPSVKNKNRILSGYVYKGFGKTGFQLLQESYRLILEGDSVSYKKLWQEIISKNSRTKISNHNIEFSKTFPVYPDEPLELEVIGNSNSVELLHDGIKIPLREDELIDDIWRTKVWPDSAGWHTVKIAGDSASTYYFVSEKNSWSALSASRSIAETKIRSANANSETKMVITYEPSLQWLWFTLLLMSAGSLWLLPKL